MAEPGKQLGLGPAAAPAEVAEVTLEGTLDRVVHRSEESGWTVARLRLDAGGEANVVGGLVGLERGARLRLRGVWEEHRKFGRQFKVVTYQTLDPATAEGIERYLGSGLVAGIGTRLARRLVARFGLDTLEVIARQPERLVEVEGIGRVRAERIGRAVKDGRVIQDVMVFLQGLGISPGYAARIYKRFGADSIARVRENPYRLALDVWGVGFRTADAIARHLGIDAAAPARAEAGLLHHLGELAEAGHTRAPLADATAGTAELLGVPAPLVAEAAVRLAAAGRVVSSDEPGLGPALALRALDEAERVAAAGIRRLLASGKPRPPAPEVVAAAEQAAGITLARRQREAVLAATGERVAVITGGPGTGKTTIVRTALRVLEAEGRRVALAAPTGRAAKRLSEATGRPASTLHRLLEFLPESGGFARDASHPLDADVVIVDEASMLDAVLAARLFDAVAATARLVLVGDVDQLPSVGPGRVLGDLITSGVAATVRLDEIFRQAAASAIVTAAHAVNRGELPDLEQPATSDFFFIERDEPAAVVATVLELVAHRIPRRFGLDPRADVAVLVPMHRGEVGAQNLNRLLQERLNPAAAGVAELAQGARVLRVGDKVLQLRNDYEREVWNGDLGRITGIDEEGQVVVEIDGRPIAYEPAQLDELALAYAQSVHKAQGSEFPAVVLPLTTAHYLLLVRNLLYTAITRGRRLVVVVGSRRALRLALRNDESRARRTGLASRLRAQK